MFGCLFALLGIIVCIVIALILGFGVWGVIVAIPSGFLFGWASGIGLTYILGILQDPIGWKLRNKKPLDPVVCVRCGDETKAMSAQKFGGCCRKCAEETGQISSNKILKGTDANAPDPRK